MEQQSAYHSWEFFSPDKKRIHAGSCSIQCGPDKGYLTKQTYEWGTHYPSQWCRVQHLWGAGASRISFRWVERRSSSTSHTPWVVALKSTRSMMQSSAGLWVAISRRRVWPFGSPTRRVHSGLRKQTGDRSGRGCGPLTTSLNAFSREPTLSAMRLISSS